MFTVGPALTPPFSPPCLAAPRERYEALINDPARIERELKRGAERARAIATPFIRELRDAVGICPLA